MSEAIGPEKSSKNTSRMILLLSSATALRGQFSQVNLAYVRHGQGLNARDNGLNIIVGVRKDGASWKQAQEDGWVPGKNLFEVEEAIKKGTIIMNLLSVCFNLAVSNITGRRSK